MGIAVDIILLLIFVLNIFIGYKKGLIKVAFNIFAFLVAVIITLFVYQPVANILINNTTFDDKIKELIISNNQDLENEKDTEANINTIDDNSKDNVMRKYIEEQIKNVSESTKTKTLEVVATIISKKVIQILTAVILFFAIRIFLILLKFISETIANLPIIKQFNELGGIIYGGLKSFVIIYLCLTIIFIFSLITKNTTVTDIIQESFITRFLYENNMIVKYCLLNKNLL